MLAFEVLPEHPQPAQLDWLLGITFSMYSEHSENNTVKTVPYSQ